MSDYAAPSENFSGTPFLFSLNMIFLLSSCYIIIIIILLLVCTFFSSFSKFNPITCLLLELPHFSPSPHPPTHIHQPSTFSTHWGRNNVHIYCSPLWPPSLGSWWTEVWYKIRRLVQSPFVTSTHNSTGYIELRSTAWLPC